MRSAVLTILALMATLPAAAQTVSGPGASLPAPKPSGPGMMSRSAPVNGVVVLYGNERCPTDKDGNEVVVCVRRNASEQFRVPKELRDFKVTPENESWAMRSQSTLDTGASGTGSCTAIGPGGGIGCSNRQFSASKQFNKERKEDEKQGQ